MDLDLVHRFKLLLKVIIFIAVAWLFGFFIFLSKIPNSHTDSPVHTDAIVILTGGAFRIEEGLKLLADLPVKKLLISGVGDGVTAKDLASPEVSALIKLHKDKVILGNIANSTISNAFEAKLFMGLNGFKSLLVVTSSYHMPRTELIFSNVLADFEVAYYPIFSSNFNKQKDYISLNSSYIVLREYNKYLATYVLLLFEQLTSYWDVGIFTIANYLRGLRG